jgi:hypothetical protein
MLGKRTINLIGKGTNSMFEFDLRKRKDPAKTANEMRGKKLRDIARAKLGRHQYMDDEGGHSYDADPMMDLTKAFYRNLDSKNHVPEDNRITMDARRELTKDREFKMPSPRESSPSPRATVAKAAASAPGRVNRKEADDITARLNRESAAWTAAHPYQAKKAGGTVGFKDSYFMKECRKHKGS